MTAEERAYTSALECRLRDMASALRTIEKRHSAAKPKRTGHELPVVADELTLFIARSALAPQETAISQVAA